MAMHYDPSSAGYYPCSLDTNACPGCHQFKQLPRWCGYADALILATGEPRVLALSSEAWAGCPKLHEQQGRLRGLVVRVSRPNKRINGRVTAQVLSSYPDDQLPAAREIRPGLCQRWGLAPDWWEWHVGLDPAGLPCPALPAKVTAGTDKGVSP